MLYLVLLRYRASLVELDRHLQAHRDFLARHYGAGHFLLSGRQEPRQGGVILACADSREDVAKWISEDPFHQAELADYEIIAWLPSFRHKAMPAEIAPEAFVVES